MNDSFANMDLVRAEFPITRTCVFLNHAAAGPISRPVRDAMVQVADDHLNRALLALPAQNERIAAVRRLAADLVGVTSERIAFIDNTSHGLSLAANGFPWTAGDNVVLPDNDFPSNVYPWLNLELRGVELRRVAARGAPIDPADLLAALDQRTRILAISSVQYSTGARNDLAALAQACRSRDCLLVVDGTQSVGALSLDVAALGIDLLAVSAHKWLMGPFGTGFAAFSERAFQRLTPPVLGWLSVEDPFSFHCRLDLLADARRFEPGTENSAGILGLGGTLGLIRRYGIAAIERRVLALTDHLCETAQRRGGRVASPRGDAASGIVICHPAGDVDRALANLEARNVLVSKRAGGIRLSPHYYNTTEELDLAVDLLSGRASPVISSATSRARTIR